MFLDRGRANGTILIGKRCLCGVYMVAYALGISLDSCLAVSDLSPGCLYDGCLYKEKYFYYATLGWGRAGSPNP